MTIVGARPGVPALPARPANDARPVSMHGAVIAFDFGLKRIGVAVGDSGLRIAHPLDAIAFDDNRRRFEAIAAVVAQWQPSRFVVGMPHLADGSVHPLAPAIERFVRRLRARFGLPVETIDETLSSWEAGRALAQSGIRGRSQKAYVDSMAAREILETWFGEARPPEDRP